MSDTENRDSTPAPQGEAIAATPIAIHADAATPAAPATPKTRIADSSLEAAHADLPPLSSLGDTAPASQSVAPTAATQGNGARRGRGRGAPADKLGASTGAKTPIGAVENPADMTENLSGKFVTGYADTRPAPARFTPATAAVPATEADAAPQLAPKPDAEAVIETAPKAAESTGVKEFIPPVSEGSFKADLNPEAERKAREERRQQREQRPQGEPRPAREPRPQGGEFRGPREPRPQGGEFRGPREPRAQQHERPARDERRQGAQGGEGRPERARPGRLTIEAPKVPVQQDLSLFGKIKRFFAEKFFGVPSAEKLEYTTVSRQPTPHSREWQFGRNNQGGNRHGGDQRHGNRQQGQGGRPQGGEFRGNRGDSRHRPHQRGGNHRDHHGRDGNPRG